MPHACSQTCPLLGRILLSAIFVMSGGRKIFNWDQTAQQMADEGMVANPVLLILGLGAGPLSIDNRSAVASPKAQEAS